LPDPKLFLVDGIKHSAIVIADSPEEAVRLADFKEEPSPMVLHGYVDSWELPQAQELKLPQGYRLVFKPPGP